MRALAKRESRRAMTFSWGICWLKPRIWEKTYRRHFSICLVSDVLFVRGFVVDYVISKGGLVGCNVRRPLLSDLRNHS